MQFIPAGEHLAEQLEALKMSAADSPFDQFEAIASTCARMQVESPPWLA